MVEDAGTPVADLRRVQQAVQHLIDGVRPEQWTAPTPCSEWNVRMLVNHLVGADNMFAALATGRAENLEAARRMRESAGDQLGEDPAAAYRSATQALDAAFDTAEFLAASWPTPFGEQPGEFLVGMRTIEHMVHGWDLAEATAQSPDGLPQDLAERELQRIRERLPGGSRQGGPFGSEQPAPADAPPIARLAAFLGRRL